MDVNIQEKPILEKPWQARTPTPDLILKNASIIDVVNGRVLPNRVVHISGGLIRSISLYHSPLTQEQTKECQQIDLAGKFLCPGLIDCHVHMTATPGSLSLDELFQASPNTIAYRTSYVARTMLMRGFTTVRDTGGADSSLRSAIAEGLLPGPRVFIAGRALSQTGGHGDFRRQYEGESAKCCGGISPSLARICDGVPACLEAARDELRQGADFLKIMCGGGVVTSSDPLQMVQFTAEEIRAITTTAAYSGKYVTAHAYTNEAIRHAVDNGVMGIEHGNFVDAETAAYCASKGVAFTPTLITYHAMTKAPYDNFLGPAGKEKNAQVLAQGLKSLEILRDARVMMCYGSDLLAGLHVLQNGEFSIRATVLSNIDVLRSATVNAGRMLGFDGKLGVVREGAIADLLVLTENPLEDVGILDKEEYIRGIVKDGKVVMSKVDGLRTWVV